MKFKTWLSLIAALALFAGCAEKQPPVFQLIKLYQDGKYDETIALAEKITAQNPDDSEAHRFLILSLVRKNNLAEYKQKYEKLAQEHPQSAGYHFGLGYLYIQMQDYEKGLAELEKSLQLNPALEYAHYVIGWTHIRSKYEKADPELGLAEWKKEEELNPKSLGALQVYNDRADYYLRRGDSDAAEKDYEKITLYAFAPGDISGARNYITQLRTLRDELARLQADVKDKPEDGALRAKLAILQYKNGKVDEAIETWLKAAELDPKNVETHNYLGKALLEKKRYSEASEQFQKVLELDKNMAAAYYNLAVAEECLGQSKSAVKNYQKYIELNPMAPKLDEIKQRITTLEDSAAAKQG